MSDVNKGEDDPAASTVMFQRFVDDGTESTRARQRPVRAVAIAVAVVAVVAVVVVVLLAQG